MEYTLSIGSFFLGLLIIAVSAAILFWYRQIAENMMSSTASYDKLRLWAVFGVIIGLLVMFNLHMFILGWLVGLVFHRS